MTRVGRAAHWPVVTVVVVSAALAAVVVSGRGADADAGMAPAQADEGQGTEVGRFLYGRDCAGCHGPDGEGSPRGVELTDSGEAGAHYMLTTGRMPIDDPDGEVRRGPSPYTDEEIAALVDHVAGLGDGPALPEIDVGGGDLSRGGVLYRLHCAACHGSTGIGGALVAGEFAPSLSESDPLVVAAAVTSGPGAMPAFAPLGFTDEELDAIVVYVQELRDSSDRGGWPIFRAGRVDEGMVAWLLGLPILVLFSAWMARRVR